MSASRAIPRQALINTQALIHTIGQTPDDVNVADSVPDTVVVG
jgi:hypothetical protein